MALQVMDIKLDKSMSRGQSNEHLRNFSKEAHKEKRTHNWDPTREKLNFEIQEGGVILPVEKDRAIDTRIKLMLENRGIKDPNMNLDLGNKYARNTVMNIIFEGSRNRMRELAFGDQKIQENDEDVVPDNSHVERKPEIEDWALDMYNFACKKFAEKNIAAFVCHLDEKNPHIHCTIIPIIQDKGRERISAAAYIGKDKHEARRIIIGLHDELAEVNKRWGLERGRDVQTTGARHRTTEEYWKWLSEQCTEKEEKKHGLESEIKLLELEKAKAEKSVKGLKTMIANLNEQVNELENNIENLKEDQSIEEEEKQKQLEELTKKLNDTKNKLDDKQQKLDVAQERFEELQRRCKAADDKVTETNKIINSLMPEATHKSQSLAESLAWNAVCNELRRAHQVIENLKPSMSFAEREGAEKVENAIFDDEHLLKDLTESGAQIVAVASMLFLGNVEMAMSYAQTSGGGGGGPKSGWGRKKDDDDFHFMQRCFLSACSMMKPPTRIVKVTPNRGGFRR